MKPLIVGILTIFSIVVHSQDCTYSFLGELKDFHDGSPITNASVYVKELNNNITSNNDGVFKIEKLCKQRLTLTISHINCTPKTLTINLTDDMVKTILLEHHIEELGEVTVSGHTIKKETKTAQETILKAETLKRYTNLSLGDALKEVPGVSALNTGNTIVKPMINGLHSSRLIIMNNGVRLQDQDWGIEHAPNIDVNSANQISVIKGSGALAFGGDAIGGVIVIKPSKAILKDTLYGKTIVGAQTNGRGYFLNTSLNKNYKSGWFAHIQGSYKKNGDFKTPDYNLTNTGINTKGITAQFGKRTFESGFEIHYSYLDNVIGILRSAHIGNLNDLQRAINSGQPSVINDFSYAIDVPRQEVTHHTVKANYYKRLKNFGKLNLQYDYQYNQRFEFDVRIGDRRKIPAVDLTLQTHSVLADINLDANLDRKVNFGIMGRYQNNFANPDTGVRRLIPDYDKYDFGTYLTTEWRLKDNLLVDAGIRYDFSRTDAKKFYRQNFWNDRGYDQEFSDIIIEDTPTQFLTNPILDFHNISASAGLKYELNANNQLVVNYSVASRPPNPSELFSDGLHHSAARIEFGDIRFTKEVANRISGTYAYNSSKFNFTSEVYYNRIANFIYLRPVQLLNTIRGPFPVWEYQQTNAALFGIDFTAAYAITNALEWQNKTSFIKGYDTEANLPLIDMPPFLTTNTIQYRNDAWHNFLAGFTSEWSFEQNEFPDFNFEQNIQLTGETVIVDVSTPPPAYHLLHFYSEATFNLNNKTTLNIALGINNIFNTNYRNYLNQLRYFADEVGRNFTLQLQLNY